MKLLRQFALKNIKEQIQDSHLNNIFEDSHHYATLKAEAELKAYYEQY